MKLKRPDMPLSDSKILDASERRRTILPTCEPTINYISQSIQSVAGQTYDHIKQSIVDRTGLNGFRELGEKYRGSFMRVKSQ